MRGSSSNVAEIVAELERRHSFHCDAQLECRLKPVIVVRADGRSFSECGVNRGPHQGVPSHCRGWARLWSGKKPCSRPQRMALERSATPMRR